MDQRKFGTIIQIGDVLVSEDVVMEPFACDYAACHGACCIEGDSGAPLKEEELDLLERDYPAYNASMTPQGRATVQEKGFFEVDRDNDIVTPLVTGSCECAFCHFGPDGGCLCAIETAGRTKPVSCSIYPIRVTRLTGGGLALNVHQWDICAPAREKGRREGIKVYQFLEKALTQAFGADFYEALCAAATHLRG